MSWHYSQALEAEFSGASSAGGGQCALLKSQSTHDDDCCNGRMTEPCLASPYGMTSRPLTGDRGVDSWISSLAASRVRTSAQPERRLVSPAPVRVSGGRWRGSSVKYGRDSRSWKTALCLLPEDSIPYSGTWPRWGMMRNGECWELQTPERGTSGTGSGSLLPTPTADEVGSNKSVPSLYQMATRNLWPTPTAHDGRDRDSPSALLRRTPGLGVVVSRDCGGCLNPDWVEWLMGWPGGWTIAETLAKEAFGQWMDAGPSYIQNEPDNLPRSVAPRTVPNRGLRLKAIGNGQGPHVVAMAWAMMTQEES